MNVEELASLETELRGLLAEAGLQWILTQVDAAISEGTPEPGETDPPDVPLFRLPDHLGRGRRTTPKKAVRSVPYSPRGRMELLISAIEHATAEPPMIHEALFKSLAEGSDDDTRPTAQSIVFLPDEDAPPMPAPPSLDSVLSESARFNRELLLENLRLLREEVLG